MVPALIGRTGELFACAGPFRGRLRTASGETGLSATNGTERVPMLNESIGGLAA